MKVKKLTMPTETSEKMEKELVDVLNSMPMELDIKRYIHYTLRTDDQIEEFLCWLANNMPYEEIEEQEDEISWKAQEIAKDF